MQSAEQKRRIVVGDIHGELDGFREILRNAGLIDSKDKWSGGDRILIQTGDVIDRVEIPHQTGHQFRAKSATDSV